MRKLLSIVMAIVIVSASCKKDSGSTDVTKASLVGTYKTTALSYQTGSSPSVDIFSLIPACQKDDVQKLNADMSYNYVDAGTACSPSSSYNGTWSLISSSKIVLDGDTSTIKSFDGTTLVIQGTEVTSGVSTVYTGTLVKQ